MVKRLLIILMLVGFVPVCAYAEDIDQSASSVPVQSFQEAGTPSAAASSSTAQSSPKAVEPSKPSAQSAAVAAVEAEKPAVSASTADNNQPSSVTTSTVDRTSATLLQAELVQLNQNNLQFQQQTDERLIELATKNQQLQQQLHQLTEALGLLNQELQRIKKMNGDFSSIQNHPIASESARVSIIRTFANWLEQKIGSFGLNVTLTVAILVLFLIVWATWPRGKKKTALLTASFDDPDTKDEYDYMGSAESIPAKLNLARTYIAMEDFISARKVLGEVFELGNTNQREEADNLLKALPSES